MAFIDLIEGIYGEPGKASQRQAVITKCLTFKLLQLFYTGALLLDSHSASFDASGYADSSISSRAASPRMASPPRNTMIVIIVPITMSGQRELVR